MKKILSILICCLMMCCISFAKEEAVEPRPYYEMPLEDFESKSCGISGDNYLIKPDGYCFVYNTAGNEMITFVFTIIPIERDMDYVIFPIIIAKQGEAQLVYDEVPGYAYDFSQGIEKAMTNPEVTNGFSIPYTTFFEALKDQEYHISISYKLKNIDDDVIFEFANTKLGSFTVSIPDDAFLEPAAQ